MARRAKQFVCAGTRHIPLEERISSVTLKFARGEAAVLFESTRDDAARSTIVIFL
jgi:hypothetical protein